MAKSAGRRRARRLGKACAPLGEALFSDDDECHAASSARLRCSFRAACVSCDAAAIRRVLERSSDLASHVYDDDFTPLGYVLHGDQGAWRCGRGLASVKLVLDARAAPDVVRTRAGGFTSLQLAVYGSNENPREPRVALELVKLLLAAGAGARDRGVLSGACEVACSVGHVMCCRTLLEARMPAVQRSQQHFSHIVLDVEQSYYYKEPKYWIGNIRRNFNGWCLREHIFGILVEVQKWHDNQYHSRPHPADKGRQLVQRGV